MASVEEVKRRRQRELLQITGVVGVGIGRKDGADCINVYVEEDTPAVRAAVPKTVEGIATNIVVTGSFGAL